MLVDCIGWLSQCLFSSFFFLNLKLSNHAGMSFLASPLHAQHYICPSPAHSEGLRRVTNQRNVCVAGGGKREEEAKHQHFIQSLKQSLDRGL